MADAMFDRAEVAQQFKDAIDDLERALRQCPAELWEASIWPVARTDPWMWPREGTTPIPERTEQSIQQFSFFCNVAYHCLWYLDFYLTTDIAAFRSPDMVRGGPEEQDMADDGAARLPNPRYPRETLLAYLDYGRRRASERIRTVTNEELSALCPPNHPHAGKSLGQLLAVNLAHVQEHAAQLLAFVQVRR
jgi:hypothetical protein